MSLYQSPDLYDLYYNENNEIPLRRHYEHVLSDKNIKSIHDCSIGTGNLTFVLADMGYQVSGSDISDVMLKKAAAKAKARGLEIHLRQADFTAMDLEETYDMVMCTGNSLPHVHEDDLVDALLAMKRHIRPGGYLYIDLRNWDNILDQHKRFQAYPPVIHENKRTNLVLVRDFHENHITFNFVYTFERENQLTGSDIKTVNYYPIRKQRLEELIIGLGFKQLELYSFIKNDIKEYDKMPWYCILCQV